MTTRHDIAAAVSISLTVDGQAITIDGLPVQPATFAVWQAWPVWQSSVWLSRAAQVRTWQVLLVLPAGDIATWVDATDDILAAIRDALEDVGHVTRVEPVQLMAGDASQTMPGLAFSLDTNH
jgi:hypothetical protein